MSKKNSNQNSNKTRLLKNIVLRGGVILITGVFVFYNRAFIRTSRGTPLERKINPVPYTTHFEIEQQQPKSFFTAPAFPGYTRWCHDNQKLCTIMPLQQLYADFQWLSSIQFIGGQLTQDGLQGLHILLDNITNLAPYRSYPYAFGLILIPQAKPEGGASGTLVTAKYSREKAEELAQKSILYTCDAGKIEGISALSETGFLETVYNTGLRAPLANPCTSYESSYYAGFNAFYYRGDADSSAKYYKISSFHDGVPTIAPLMSALVYGRGGEHLKSATLWFDRYLRINEQNPEPESVLAADAEKALKKSVFELQLQLITDAEELYKQEKGITGDANSLLDTAKSYEFLQKNGYVKKAIETTFTNCVEEQAKQTQTKNTGENGQNITCMILAVGLENNWISRTGMLRYAFGDEFMFWFDDSNNSWWIQPK